MKLVYYHPIALKTKHPFQAVVNPLISVMDRTANKWPNFDYENLYPMPDPGDGAREFKDISIDRIKELTDGTGRITVLWSGGIDSTYIMSLMVELDILDKLHGHDRLTIGLNSESIREYPVFYERYIKKYMDCVVQADWILKYPENYGTIITGEMADNLVGSLTMKSCVDYYNDFSLVHKKWGIAADWLGRNLDVDDKTILRDFIEASVAGAPVEIVTNHDLMWYLNFNYKWQAVNFRIVSHADNQVSGNTLINNLKHFFNTLDFQRWSMHVGHYFTGSSWREYKMPLKEQIYSVTGDTDYYKNKTKYPSLPGLLRYRDTFDYIYYDGSNSEYVFTKGQL